MPKPKQPVDLLAAKGKKHLSKKEYKERKSSEVIAKHDDVSPPSYLTPKLKKRFTEIADELIELNIFANIDCDALARYINVEWQYQRVIKEVFKVGAMHPTYYGLLIMQEKLFKMARAAASDLGLTITSRCKLVVPKPEEKPKNRFDKYAK